jgi:prophage antirepressor-like protein
MSNIELFNYESAEVRVIVDDAGDPWWVAKDVTDLLGFKNGPDAIRKHVLPGQTNIANRDVCVTLGFVVGRPPTLINEAGFYRLILRSNVPGAERIQDWVTSEVLPTIRKTGGAYIAPGSQAALDLTDPDTMMEALENALSIAKDARAKLAEANEQIGALTPRALAAEAAESKVGGQAVYDMRDAICTALELSNKNLALKALRDLGVYRTRKSNNDNVVNPQWRDLVFAGDVKQPDGTMRACGTIRVRPGKQDEFLRRISAAREVFGLFPNERGQLALA